MNIKNCPICFEEILYRDRKALLQSMKLNSKCKKCSININKEKISKTLKEKYKNGEIIPNMEGAHSNESRKKMANSKKGKKQTEESNKKRSISCKKSNCGKSNKGRKCSDENKIKFRIQMVERLSKTNKNFHPPYNEKGCKYFDKLMIETNTFIRHALNGGEYHIKELGYWVDGYDEINNIVYEWDEKYHHYDSLGNLNEKDIKRQKEIECFLNCRFIRLKESEMLNLID
jgi:hypothetical protein